VLSLLARISRNLSRASDLAGLLQSGASALLASTGSHAAGLLVKEGEHARHCLFVSDQFEDDCVESSRRAFAEAASRITGCKAGGLALSPVRSMPTAPVPSEAIPRAEFSDLSIPLESWNRTLGLLWTRRFGKEGFSAEEKDLVESLALQAGLVAERVVGAPDGERQQIRAMVEGMGEPVVMFDESFGLVCLSASAKKLLGLEGFTTNLDLESLDPPQLAQLFKRALRAPDTPIEEEILFAEPTPRTCRVGVRPVVQPDHGRIGTVVVFHDVTQWREAQQVKNEFVANVSHELRTPLTSIKEAIALLYDEVVGKVNERQRECLEIASQECARLVRLINDILEISRIEAARLHLHRTRESVSKITEASLNSLRPAAEQAGISLDFSPPSRLPRIFVDADRVTQILVNLLGNAIRFTPRGGSVRVVLEDGKEAITVRVIDTGPGVPKEEAARIFEKFHQVSTITAPGKKGTGLGLSICKALVEMHGGTIHVSGDREQGAEFVFTLPKVDEGALIEGYLDSLVAQARKTEQSAGVLWVKLRSSRKGREISSFRQRVLEVLKKTVYKANDRIFRWNNDTLLIVLWEADAAGVMAVQKRLERAIESELGETVVGWSIEWGSVIYPDDGHSAEELLAPLRRERRARKAKGRQQNV
jgi:signal transduction histidine kinase